MSSIFNFPLLFIIFCGFSHSLYVLLFHPMFFCWSFFSLQSFFVFEIEILPMTLSAQPKYSTFPHSQVALASLIILHLSISYDIFHSLPAFILICVLGMPLLNFKLIRVSGHIFWTFCSCCHVVYWTNKNISWVIYLALHWELGIYQLKSCTNVEDGIY